jgi:hypothetical protein
VLCSTAAAVETTLAIARLGLPKPRSGGRAPTPAVASRGLGDALAARLEGQSTRPVIANRK